MEPINVSNTTLSLRGNSRHRKFDVKQAKRHSFGKAHCVICDEVFTKYYYQTNVCSDECKRKKRIVISRKYREDNRETERAKARKYREENREKMSARQRKYREENPEKIKASQRKYREKRLKDPEWVKRYNAKSLARYHAKKKQED